jgi:cytochrome c oxidase accessory protein FixG
MRRNAGPWTSERLARAGLTHAGYVIASFGIAHVVLAYFVPVPRLLAMVGSDPTRHMEAFVWAMALTGVLYFNFGFFREQLCLAICPYGRLQSVLIDADSITVGYDARRGEPRGKVLRGGREEEGPRAGDCVDCKRCVVVCPTGIDIRNGLQVDCVACTACIDACDDVMDRLQRPRGLVRYASTSALAGNKTRYLRPRVVLYTAFLLVGLVAAAAASGHHQTFEANLLRLPGPPYAFDGADIRDGFEVHVVNKSSHEQTYAIRAEGDCADAAFVVPVATVNVQPLEGMRIPVTCSPSATTPSPSTSRRAGSSARRGDECSRCSQPPGRWACSVACTASRCAAGS